MVVGPAVVLAAVTGLFHASAYVVIRGTAGGRWPVIVLAAFLGAWAGDAIGGRLGVDPIRIGDFNLLAASVLAWMGIGVVAIVAILGPDRRREAGTRP